MQAAASIWLVDDDRSIRRVLTQALETAGFAVRAFADAESALSASASSSPDLVFTDVRMGELDGLGFLRKLRRESPVPVIVMSAYTDLETTVAAFSDGAIDYLPKPFDLDRAVDLAQRHLPTSTAIPQPKLRSAGLIGDTPGMVRL